MNLDKNENNRINNIDACTLHSSPFIGSRFHFYCGFYRIWMIPAVVVKGAKWPDVLDVVVGGEEYDQVAAAAENKA